MNILKKNLAFLINKGISCLIYAIQNTKTYFEDLDELDFHENLVKVPESFYRNIIDKNLNGQLEENESINNSHLDLSKKRDKQNSSVEVLDEKSSFYSSKKISHFDESNYKERKIKSK